MRSIWTLVFCVACSVDHSGLIESDSGPGFDGDPMIDSDLERMDAGPRPDVPGSVDAGRDVPPPITDSGLPDTLVVVLDAPPMVDSGPDVPPDPGCTIGDQECVDDGSMRECMDDGWMTRPCALDCREGGGRASCFDLVPSNLTRPLSDAPGGDVIVPDNYWDTDDCEFLANFWYVETVGELDLCVVSFDDVTFQTDLRVVGTRGLVIVAKGTITLEAEIRADAQGSFPGPGGTGGGAAASGVGYSGGNGGSREVPGEGFRSDGGGGGGGSLDEGGQGGTGGSGSTTAAGGSRGPEFGDGDRLIPLRASGGGGAGGGFAGGLGGGGGGAIQFSARGDILVRDRIHVSGGGGSGGSNGGGGGGGGAGGSVHFECAGEIRFEGGNQVLAAGAGGGGGGGCSSVSGAGAEEESGSTAGGVRGGNCGSDLSLVVATDGGDGSPDRRGGSATNISLAGGNGGGGGGSGGFVVIRATDEMGSLAGSGHRRSENPEIAAVD